VSRKRTRRSPGAKARSKPVDARKGKIAAGTPGKGATARAVRVAGTRTEKVGGKTVAVNGAATAGKTAKRRATRRAMGAQEHGTLD
jgi:hypothetical protein